MAFRYSPRIVTDGLVLYLDAANPYSYISGSTNWNDLSRSQVSGSLINGPTFTTTYNGGITCDGINDYITVSNDPATQFPHTNAWSFSFITELLTQNGPYPSILSKGVSTTSGILVFFTDSGSAVYFKHNNTQPTSVSVSMNKPFQYTITYSGTGAVKIYVNGEYKNNGATMVSTDTTNPLNIGFGDNYSNIRTYSFLKYSKELTPQEILQNYNATKTRFGLT